MERKRFENLKNMVVNFKLDYCCCCVPIRVGLFIIGYINVIGTCMYLVGTADGSISSPVSMVQDQILEDNAKQIIPIMVYATELAFSVVLLCGLYRHDITLVRVYMRFCIADLTASVLVYSMVVAAIGVVSNIIFVIEIVLQVYLIILVRSMIVELRCAQKEKTPIVIMSTLMKEHAEPKESVPETVVIHEPEPSDQKKPETKLETVDESPKEDEPKENIKKENANDKDQIKTV